MSTQGNPPGLMSGTTATISVGGVPVSPIMAGTGISTISYTPPTIKSVNMVTLMEDSLFSARVAGGRERFMRARVAYRHFAGAAAREIITMLEGEGWNVPNKTRHGGPPVAVPEDIAGHLALLGRLTELYAEEYKLHEVLDAEERLRTRAQEGGG